jgi:hypothetical protein
VSENQKLKIKFQYTASGHSRSFDEVQEQELKFEQGEFIPLPAVGDTVSYISGDDSVFRKVLARHFTYLDGWCVVNDLVGDVSNEEMGQRLKE